MAIPAGGLTVANLDTGTDQPDLARTEILAAVQKINEMLAKLPLYADGEQNGTGTQRFDRLKIGSESAAPWSSTTRVVDIGSLCAIFQVSGVGLGIAKNLYTDDNAATWKYRSIGVGQLIWFGGGGEVGTYTAPSAGGAGTAASISSRLQVDNNGAVTFGANTAWHSGNDGAGSGLDADLVRGQIPRHDGNTFHGRVSVNGAAIRLPPGWTSTQATAGVYTITHNLGTLNYTPTASPASTPSVGSAPTVAAMNTNANSFQIWAWNEAGTLVNMYCNFILMLD